MKSLSLAGCLLGCTTSSVIQIGRECQLLTHVDFTGVAGLEDAAGYEPRFPLFVYQWEHGDNFPAQRDCLSRTVRADIVASGSLAAIERV